MDVDRPRKSGLFGLYSNSDPSLNVPVTSSRDSTLSPYLNIDPAYIIQSPDSQYIFPEGASHRRGRFELAFSQIGGSVMMGASLGAMRGLYTGFRETKVAQLSGAVKRTQMLNYITKQGASTAQTLGVVALMYSVVGVLLSKLRSAEDELNTLAAATTTGMLYKSTAGLKKCVRGGGVGFGLAVVYVALTSKDRLKQMAGIRD